ncbi:hypothetical protein AVEN_205756-1, partial [Araneus ventricosus]
PAILLSPHLRNRPSYHLCGYHLNDGFPTRSGIRYDCFSNLVLEATVCLMIRCLPLDFEDSRFETRFHRSLKKGVPGQVWSSSSDRGSNYEVRPKIALVLL